MPAVSVTIPGLQSARYLWRRIESMLGSDTRNSSSLGSQGKLMSLIKPVIKGALNKLGYDIRRTPPERSKIKLLDSVSRELQKIEKLADNLTRSEVLRKLRALSLSDFGLSMLSIPNPDFPKLSAVLPRMAKEEVQIGWTGTSGVDLLAQTVDFVRSLAYNFKFRSAQRFISKTQDCGCG